MLMPMLSQVYEYYKIKPVVQASNNTYIFFNFNIPISLFNIKVRRSTNYKHKKESKRANKLKQYF